MQTIKCKNGEELVVLREYRDNGKPFLDLFCNVCFHEWDHVTKGNVYKRGCTVCDKIARIEKLFEKQQEVVNSFGETSIIVVGKRYDYFKFKCLKCGMTFEQKWSRKRAIHCLYCSKYAKANVFQAYQRLNVSGRGKLKFVNPSEFVSMNKPINIKCSMCGRVKRESPRTAEMGGCAHCAGSAKKTLSERAQEVKKHSHGHVKLTDMFKDGKYTKGKFMCEYGHTFTASINGFLTSQGMCRVCFSSEGEGRIYNWLSDNGIPFERQKRFKDCRDKGTLPFDFFISKRVLVEFDGIQHFGENTLFDTTDPYADRKRRDNIKTNWAENNNIPLYRIKYTDINKTEEIMEKIIKENNIEPGDKKYPVNKHSIIYPDVSAYKYVRSELERKGVSLEAIAHDAYVQQKKFNPQLVENDFVIAADIILHKREVLNNCMVGLSLDNLATKGMLSEPLQTIIAQDQPAFGVDETIALDICSLYGSIAVTQFGHLDLSKDGLAKTLDSNENGEVNTFIDDIVSALISCTEAKVMHQNAGE